MVGHASLDDVDVERSRWCVGGGGLSHVSGTMWTLTDYRGSLEGVVRHTSGRGGLMSSFVTVCGRNASPAQVAATPLHLLDAIISGEHLVVYRSKTSTSYTVDVRL